VIDPRDLIGTDTGMSLAIMGLMLILGTVAATVIVCRWAWRETRANADRYYESMREAQKPKARVAGKAR
jgi:hypothetical protein